MTQLSPTGFGTGAWGSSPWGGNLVGELDLEDAEATSENVIQLEFSRAVYFSGLLDQFDASKPEYYTITTVAGSVGADGTVTRPVTVVEVDVVDAPGFTSGQILALMLDRPMTPFPSEYLVTLSTNIKTADLSQSLVVNTFTLFGVYRILQRPATDAAMPSPDFANPQSLMTALGSTASFPFDPRILGVFPTDDTNDYAIDQGSPSLYKRIFRRLFTRPGAFLHLGQSYGVGVQDYGKKLGTAQVRNQLVAQIETQIAQEPEVAKCEATTQLSTDNPGLFRIILAVKLKTGGTRTYAFPVPLV